MCPLVPKQHRLGLTADKDIIKSLGYKAKEYNESFLEQKGRLVNLFTDEFMKKFCVDGKIDWKKVVEFNSGNLDLKK